MRPLTHALCELCFAAHLPGRVVPRLDVPREDVCCLCGGQAGVIYVREGSAIPALPWACGGEHV
jgi:hypothetical protein